MEHQVKQLKRDLLNNSKNNSKKCFSATLMWKDKPKPEY